GLSIHIDDAAAACLCFNCIQCIYLRFSSSVYGHCSRCCLKIFPFIFTAKIGDHLLLVGLSIKRNCCAGGYLHFGGFRVGMQVNQAAFRCINFPVICDNWVIGCCEYLRPLLCLHI